MWLGRTYRSLGSGATRRPSRGASAASALFAWFLRGRRNSTVNESRTFDIGIGIIRSLRYTAAVASFFCLPAENQRKTEKKKKREGKDNLRSGASSRTSPLVKSAICFRHVREDGVRAVREAKPGNPQVANGELEKIDSEKRKGCAPRSPLSTLRSSRSCSVQRGALRRWS